MKELMELSKDRELVKKVMGAGSPKEAFQLLEARGLSCDYEEFLKTMENMKQVYEKQKSGLLTEQDMDDLLDTENTSEMLGTPFFFLLIGGAV